MGDDGRKFVVVSDFDGTLTPCIKLDPGASAPENYETKEEYAIQHSWGLVRNLMEGVTDHTSEFLQGKITLREWIRTNYEQALPKMTDALLKKMYSLLEYREGYKDFISYCKKNLWEDGLKILSSGFTPLLKMFCGEYKLPLECSEYEVNKGKVGMTKYIDRAEKKKYLEELVDQGYDVFYIADDYFGGAEPVESDFDEKYRGKIIRACMGPCNPNGHNLLVSGFREAVQIIEKIRKSPEAFAEYKTLLNSGRSGLNGYSCIF